MRDNTVRKLAVAGLARAFSAETLQAAHLALVIRTRDLERIRQAPLTASLPDFQAGVAAEIESVSRVAEVLLAAYSRHSENDSGTRQG